MTMQSKLRDLILAAGISAALALPSLANAGTSWDLPIVWPDGNFHTKNARMFAEEVKKNKGGIALDEDFDQDAFDNLVLGICRNKALINIKQGMFGLERQEYFFSRFKFIADKIEERINA